MNQNTLWAEIFVDELARSGVKSVCIAPGSRSTPLTLAFSAHPGIEVFSMLDERGMAFFALGRALATKLPVAVLCTSGTATANYYPAIIEANRSHIPLIVLTADRPHELRDSGANQTIDQVKMFGDHVRWFVDVALPESKPLPKSLRYLRALACRAASIANGVPPGPVHLNFPFRKPLEPTHVPDFEDPEELWNRDGNTPFTRIKQGIARPSDDQILELVEVISQAEYGWIVCGPNCPGGNFPSMITNLSEATGYPIFADALSGVRFGSHVGSKGFVLGGYENYLSENQLHEWQVPRLILQFGHVPTSKALNESLENLPLATRRISILSYGDWRDDGYMVSDLIWADPEATCKALLYHLENKPKRNFELQTELPQIEEKTWQSVDAILQEAYFEGAILADILDLMPDDGNLFTASSLPVRHLDQFARPTHKSIRALSNRGASGIDGTIASAVGAASVSTAPLVLVIGDIAFYHDLNSLFALKQFGSKVTIVLINNDGGGIFHRLPVSDYEPPFTNLFITPHGLSFEPVVRMFGIDYQHVSDRNEFRDAFSSALKSDQTLVIEVTTDSERHESMRRMLTAAIHNGNISGHELFNRHEKEVSK